MTTNRIGNAHPGNQLSGAPGLESGKAQDAKAAKGVAEAAPQVGGSGGKGKAAPGTYDVNISHGAKDRAAAFQKALDIAKSTPDIREDRVQALKAQVQNGTYKVDSGQIADGMLREAVKEHLAETEEV